MTIDERDRIALRSMDSPVIRFGILLATIAVIVAGPVLGEIHRPGLYAVLLSTGLVLALVVAIRPWNRLRPARDDLADRIVRLWQTLSALIGFAILAVYVVAVVDTPVVVFGPVYAMFQVVGAYTLPLRRRPFLLGWLLASWGAALWFDGVRGGPLVLQVTAVVAVTLVSVRVADARRATLADETRSREEAEQYATLLASVVGTNTLEPDDVLDAVTDGLGTIGFAGAQVCVTGDEGMVSGAIAGHLPPDVDVSPRLVIDTDRLAASSGVVDVDPREDERLRKEFPRLSGVLMAPLLLGDDDRGVLVAVTADAPPTALQREAVELLAAAAGRALSRATAFAVDRRVVEDLRHLDDRTHDFVTTVSHELRTPLTVVHGLGQTLRQRWDDLDVGQRDDLLDRVSSNIARLEEMVGSLLDTSALDREDLLLRRESLDLRAIVHALLHRLSTVVASHAVVVDVPDGVRVDADESLLEHVLENLVTNAIKHTPDGTEIRIRAAEADGVVEVEIADDGPGIGPDDLPFVMDRFYRGGSPTQRTSSGLGLGLAFTRQILDAHGTSLEVASDVGAGARFSFRLPAAARR